MSENPPTSKVRAPSSRTLIALFTSVIANEDSDSPNRLNSRAPTDQEAAEPSAAITPIALPPIKGSVPGSSERVPAGTAPDTPPNLPYNNYRIVLLSSYSVMRSRQFHNYLRPLRQYFLEGQNVTLGNELIFLDKAETIRLDLTDEKILVYIGSMVRENTVRDQPVVRDI